jgi:hypothetical protein
MHKPSPDGCGWRYVWNDLEMWWHGDFSIVLTKAAFMKTSYLARARPPKLVLPAQNCEGARNNPDPTALMIRIV